MIRDIILSIAKLQEVTLSAPKNNIIQGLHFPPELLRIEFNS